MSLQTLPIPIAIITVAVLVTAVTDIWKFKVHNALTLPLLVTGFVYHGLAGGWPALGGSVVGALFGFGVLVALYAMGGMGAGDVKLMAAIGAWLGMPLIFYVFIGSSLAAGIYAVIVICLYGSLGETVVNLRIVWHRISVFGRHLGADERLESEVNRVDRRGHIIPFAAMVAIGLVLTLLWAWHQGSF